MMTRSISGSLGRVVAFAVGGLGAPLTMASAQYVEPRPVPMVEHEQTGSRDYRIITASTRNDAVSGGDVLLRIEAPPDVSLDELVVTLNGQRVEAPFRAPTGAGTLIGLVDGLRLGDNTVSVQGPGGATSSLVVTNWPREGPILSGPKQQPFICMTERFELPVTGGTLGPALDGHCSVATRVDYIYRTTGEEFRPLPDPSVHPADLAYTTTNERRTVAFIVRVETGTVNRSIYQSSILHDPTTDPPVDPWTRPRGWNGRVVYTFGGGCPGGWYVQGNRTGGVLDVHMLSHGFAVASSSLNVFGVNCDDLLSAETAMMVKERFIERYGAADHTIGWGCSGGSDQVHQIGDNYPGLLDGIVPACSFPDVPFAHTTTHSFGARLLYHYFTENASVSWTREEQVAMAGFPSYETLMVQATRPDRINPRGACSEAISDDLLYDPATNAGGARCTTYDHGVNAWGRNPATGFARRPLDNVGVQYGLKAFNDGTITKAQFLDLNEKIGGVDIDANLIPERTVGDRLGARNGYRTGRFLSGGGGLSETPIIDYRAYADARPGDPHMRFHGFSTRHRLMKANGHADNHVMLVEDYTYGGFSTESPLVQEALAQMDRWLLNLGANTSGAPRSARVVAAKPDDLGDLCIVPHSGGQRIPETQLYQAGMCDRHFPSHGSVYLAAGMPVSNDIVICEKKPVDPTDYVRPFTPEELGALGRIFPDGVCDYSKPGIEQQPLMDTWLSFGPAGERASPSAAR